MWICKADKAAAKAGGNSGGGGGGVTPAPPVRVLVTGAGGQTGRIVLRKLLERGPAQFEPRGAPEPPLRLGPFGGKERLDTGGRLTREVETPLPSNSPH